MKPTNHEHLRDLYAPGRGTDWERELWAEKAQRDADRRAYAHVLGIARAALFGLLSPTRPVGARKRGQEALVFIDEILNGALADHAPSESNSEDKDG